MTVYDSAPVTTTARPTAEPALSVGVEEEFLLVDRRSRRVVPMAPRVLAAAEERLPFLEPEITQFQLETITPVCRSMDELRRNLVAGRSTLTKLVHANGLRLAATGTPVLGAVTRPPLTDSPRYRRMVGEFHAVADGLAICGCHVHVGIPSPADGIRISNHLRSWLPVLLAISANSPYWEGRDTGYASWRHLVWTRWPSSGAPPVFDSVDQYEHAVQSLLRTGAAMDRGMVYWDVRLSHRHPTVELRICDVAATTDEAVLIAALTRAIALTTLIDGRSPTPPAQHALRAAIWRAARDGLDGRGVSPLTGETLPAVMVVKQLVSYVQPALAEAGDLELVAESVSKLIVKGGGASRQRKAHASAGKLADVVDMLTAQTASTNGLA